MKISDGHSGCDTSRTPAQASASRLLELQLEKQENRTVYKIVYSGVTVKPETQFISLKRLVGPRGRFSNFSDDAHRP